MSWGWRPTSPRRRARTRWRWPPRSPGAARDAVRGAKALFNRLANAGAAEQFAEERRVIGTLIGTPNQVEAVTANFEQRPAKFTEV